MEFEPIDKTTTSRMQIDNEEIVVDLLYTFPGDFNMDPGENPISYSLLHIPKDDGQHVLLGALWIADTGAAGFFPAASAGLEGEKWESIWTQRQFEARIKYGRAGDTWSARSWFEYWLQQISGAGGIILGNELTGNYEDIQNKMATM